MIRKFGLCLSFLAVSLAPLAAWAEGVEDYYRAAAKFYADKDYQHALDAYEGAIPYDREPYRAYIGMGNCEYSLNNKAKAIEYYQKSLETHPDPSIVQFIKKVKSELTASQIPAFNKGVNFLRDKNYKAAIPCFKEVTKYDTENLRAFYDLGYCYYATNDKPEATLYFGYYGKLAKDDQSSSIAAKMKSELPQDDRDWYDAQLELGPPFSPPFRFSGYGIRLEPFYQFSDLKDFKNFADAMKAQAAAQALIDPTFQLSATSPSAGLGLDANLFLKMADWIDVGLTGGILFVGTMSANYTDSGNPSGAQGSFSFNVAEFGLNIRTQLAKLGPDNKLKAFLEVNPNLYLVSTQVANSDTSGTTAGWTFTPVDGNFSSTGFGCRFKMGVDWKPIPNTVFSGFLGYQTAKVQGFKGTASAPTSQAGELQTAPDSLGNSAIIFVPDGTSAPAGAAAMTVDLSGLLFGVDFSVLF